MRAKPEVLATAQKALKEIRGIFFLGSSNIRPIEIKESLHDDSISVFKSLFFIKDQQRSVNALIDYSLKKIVDDNLRRNRLIGDVLENLENNDPSYKEKIFNFGMILYSMKRMSGNCGEMGIYGLFYFLKNAQEFKGINVELLCFSFPLDHCFIVLGRHFGTPFEDCKKWNADTIILDPWIGRIFSVSEFEEFWKKNFLKIKSIRDESRTLKFGNGKLTLKIEHVLTPRERAMLEKQNIRLTQIHSADICRVIEDLNKERKRSKEKLNLEKIQNPFDILIREMIGIFRGEIGKIIGDKKLNFSEKQEKIKFLFQRNMHIGFDIFSSRKDDLIFVIKELKNIYKNGLSLLEKMGVKPVLERSWDSEEEEEDEEEDEEEEEEKEEKPLSKIPKALGLSQVLPTSLLPPPTDGINSVLESPEIQKRAVAPLVGAYP